MDNYDDIINMPHHVSKVHPQMSMYQRAAQFAPFAALSGHGAAIIETARLTDTQQEPDDENIARLNKSLRILREHLKDHPQVTITYFQPDTLKDGGSYVTYEGNLRNIDDAELFLVMTDDKKIPLSNVYNIDSALFDIE